VAVGPSGQGGLLGRDRLLLVKAIIFAARVANLVRSLNSARWVRRPKPAGMWELRGVRGRDIPHCKKSGCLGAAEVLFHKQMCKRKRKPAQSQGFDVAERTGTRWKSLWGVLHELKKQAGK